MKSDTLAVMNNNEADFPKQNTNNTIDLKGRDRTQPPISINF